MIPREYLGDGVTAGHDGYHVWLSLSERDRGIALEPAVLLALVRYVVGVNPAMAAAIIDAAGGAR